ALSGARRRCSPIWRRSSAPGKDPAVAAAPGTPATGTAQAGTATPDSRTPSVVAAVGQGTPVAEAVPSSATGVPGKAEGEEADPGGKRPVAVAKPPGKKKPATVSEPAPAPAPAPAPKVRYVSAPMVLKVEEEGGKYYVERGRSAGLIPGAEVEVLGAAKGGQRPVLGLARVQRASKKGMKAAMLRRMYLELDDDALASSGDLYVPVRASPGENDPEETAQTEPAETETAEEPAPPEKKTLYGTASRQTGVASVTNPGIKVRNMGVSPWTGCSVVKEGRKTAWMGDLKPGEERVVNSNRFKVNVNFDVGSAEVGVFCKEGSFTMPLR
ncbi:hypothetical protein ACLESO_40360, partial [Pyxidicoccus sp. 3LG]